MRAKQGDCSGEQGPPWTKLTSGMDPKPIQEKLAELWKQHLPEIAERIAILERACAAWRSGTLSEQERRAATAAAHKLAGVLGTFGRMRGTELARDVEGMLQGTSPGNDDDLKGRVDQLRKIVSD